MTPAPLSESVARYLRSHHVMSLATMGPDTAETEGSVPHVASVFYAVDQDGRLVFLSKAASRHGRDVRARPDAAVAVTEQYEDWREIKGVQLHGRVEALSGADRFRALATYLVRFPFVRAMARLPGRTRLLSDVEVFRFVPSTAAFTDNSTMAFGRERWELE